MLTPQEIYKSLQNNVIIKSQALDLLILLIENINDDFIRNECIKVLNQIDVKNNACFDLLENLLLSDPNESIRNAAAKTLQEKFPEKGMTALSWALKYECSFNCLMTLISSLRKINTKEVKSVLIEKIISFSNYQYNTSSVHLIKDQKIDSLSIMELGEILKNFIFIHYIMQKFKNTEYTLENGYIITLDFSKVNEIPVYWRDRLAIQDLSEIKGIILLQHLRSLKPFPLQWAIKNELHFECLIGLLKEIKLFRKDLSQRILISEIEKIDNIRFKDSLNFNYKEQDVSSLIKILMDFYVISFLRNKYPKLDYEVRQGRVIELSLRDIKVVTLPHFIKYLDALLVLNLNNCRIHSFSNNFSTLKELRELDLGGNNLKEIPSFLNTLESLNYLDLSRNELKTSHLFLKNCHLII